MKKVTLLKKGLSAVLAGTMVLGLAACGSGSGSFAFEGTSGRTGKRRKTVDLSSLFCRPDIGAGRKRAWHISGTGLKIGKKDFKKYERTNLAGISGYIF